MAGNRLTRAWRRPCLEGSLLEKLNRRWGIVVLRARPRPLSPQGSGLRNARPVRPDKAGLGSTCIRLPGALTLLAGMTVYAADVGSKIPFDVGTRKTGKLLAGSALTTTFVSAVSRHKYSPGIIVDIVPNDLVGA
jgi:hypothetical protein